MTRQPSRVMVIGTVAVAVGCGTFLAADGEDGEPRPGATTAEDASADDSTVPVGSDDGGATPDAVPACRAKPFDAPSPVTVPGTVAGAPISNFRIGGGMGFGTARRGDAEHDPTMGADRPRRERRRVPPLVF